MLTKRRWWLGISVILLVAAVLRFLTFRVALPYYYDSDEPWFFYEAAFQRGLIPLWIPPNPSPPLIDLYKLAQIISETLTHQSALTHVADIFTAMRFISVILSLLTIVMIGLCARELADDKAGWIAAATWTVIPLVIYHSFIAIAEPWMMLCAAVCFYAAARTFRDDRLRWPILSIAAGLLGFTFKYSMFPLAGLALAAVLWKAWTRPEGRRKWLRLVGLLIVGIILFLGFMVLFGGLIQDVNGRQREVAVFFHNPLARLTDVSAVANDVAVAFWQFGFAPLVFILTYAAALWLLIRVRASATNPRLAAWVLFAALGSFSALLVPTYLFVPGTLDRYMFTATMVFLILAASSLSVIYDYLRTLPLFQKRSLVLTAASILMVILWLAPLTVQAAKDDAERLKPYTLTDLMIWASNTLGSGGVVAEGVANRAFDREWGGYTGPKRLLTFKDPQMSKSPQEWEKEGYRYVEFIEEDVNALAKTPAGNAYLSQLQELRRFPPPESTEQWTGAPFVVYQLNRPQTNADLVFGNIFHLIGYDGVQTSLKPGANLNLSFYWQALKAPDNNYSLFLHIEPEHEEQIVAQADGTPGPTGRPTLTWVIPSETLVSEPFSLKLPNDLPDGNYRLLLGVYNPYSGQRLTTPQGDQVLLETLHVSKSTS